MPGRGLVSSDIRKLSCTSISVSVLRLTAKHRFISKDPEIGCKSKHYTLFFLLVLVNNSFTIVLLQLQSKEVVDILTLLYLSILSGLFAITVRQTKSSLSHDPPTRSAHPSAVVLY